jgi:hypothetical protein
MKVYDKKVIELVWWNITWNELIWREQRACELFPPNQRVPSNISPYKFNNLFIIYFHIEYEQNDILLAKNNKWILKFLRQLAYYFTMYIFFIAY